ncbi:MAG TPA: DUF58 domain-containing protein [Methylomirabilota bacterium]|nr:DUF58 domain-containing protein [Methylomirabilota bacterium]
MRLRRYFYRQFLLFSRIQGTLARRLTPAGRLVAGALLAAMVFGPNTRLTVAYQAFTLLLALLAVAAALSLRAPARLEARRQLPRFATVGEPFAYRVVVRNLDATAHPGLSLVEDLEDPRPDFATFASTPEPEEARRNWFDRKVAYHRWAWLLEQNRRLEVAEHALPDVPPRTAVEVSVTATARRRGRARFSGLSLARPDPLGLVRALRPQALPDALVVLPRRYALPPLELPGSRRYQPGGITLASSVGDSEEFLSLREYRPGDPFKRIHWRSWARVGKPIVREYQDEFFVRHGLVLDTFVPAATPAFEEAVSVAASFAAAVRTQDSLLDLMFIGAEAYVFTAGRGVGHADRMLEVLAEVQPCRDRAFAALHRLVIERHGALSGVVCVLVAWDEARRALVDHLRALGVPSLLLLVSGEDAHDGELEAGGVRRLAPGHIREGLARL